MPLEACSSSEADDSAVCRRERLRAAYVALPLARARRAGMFAECWWRVPLLVVMKDLSPLWGAALGAYDSLRRRRQSPHECGTGGREVRACGGLAKAAPR